MYLFSILCKLHGKAWPVFPHNKEMYSQNHSMYSQFSKYTLTLCRFLLVGYLYINNVLFLQLSADIWEVKCTAVICVDRSVYTYTRGIYFHLGSHLPLTKVKGRDCHFEHIWSLSPHLFSICAVDLFIMIVTVKENEKDTRHPCLTYLELDKEVQCIPWQVTCPLKET